MFERGFKAWCERTALALRAEMSLPPTSPLPCEELARHLGIAVRSVEDIPNLAPECLRGLLGDHASSWSAVTVSNGTKSIIILNTAHSDARGASNLAHELAHGVLRHKPARVFVAPDGSLLLNTFDKKQEDEAAWLAGCLLLPREALMWIRRARLDESSAATRFGVSVAMLQYRMRVSGVEMQMQRAGRLRKRRPPSA